MSNGVISDGVENRIDNMRIDSLPLSQIALNGPCGGMVGSSCEFPTFIIFHHLQLSRVDADPNAIYLLEWRDETLSAQTLLRTSRPLFHYQDSSSISIG